MLRRCIHDERLVETTNGTRQRAEVCAAKAGRWRADRRAPCEISAKARVADRLCDVSSPTARAEGYAVRAAREEQPDALSCENGTARPRGARRRSAPAPTTPMKPFECRRVASRRTCGARTKSASGRARRANSRPARLHLGHRPRRAERRLRRGDEDGEAGSPRRTSPSITAIGDGRRRRPRHPLPQHARRRDVVAVNCGPAVGADRVGDVRPVAAPSFGAERERRGLVQSRTRHHMLDEIRDAPPSGEAFARAPGGRNSARRSNQTVSVTRASRRDERDGDKRWRGGDSASTCSTLNAVTPLPPLRERREDIMPMAPLRRALPRGAPRQLLARRRARSSLTTPGNIAS